MRVRASAVGAGLGLGLLVLGGCAYGEVRHVVRAQFANEFDCPEVQLKKRELWYSYEGPDQFKAIGCGHVRTYTCPKTGLVSYDEPVCTFVEGDADAPKTVPLDEEEPDLSAPPSDDTDTSGGEEPPSDDSGSSDDGGDDLSGDVEGDAEGSSSSHGAAHGSNGNGAASGSGKAGGKAGGKIKLGIGK